MQTQQIITAILSSHTKQEQKLIDAQKIKSILSKKLSTKISNPEQLLSQLQDEIHYQIEKTESEILKERERQDKIKLVEEREMKTRGMLEEKIKMKMQRSIKRKLSEDKEKLQSKIKARKLKEEFFTQRKQEIQQTQFRKRLERFKQIKAENNPKSQSYIEEKPSMKQNSLMKRSFSVKSTLQDAIQKSKEIEQIQYFKKMESLQKKKIYEKSQRVIRVPQSIDKKNWIERLNNESENKMIQKVGEDLWKIQQARVKKQKSMKEFMQKMKQKAEFKDQQRGYRVQVLKNDMNEKLKSRKELLNKKNERFLMMRNQSTPQLQRNWSNSSQNRDTFGLSASGKLLGTMSKMSKTLQNFKESMNVSFSRGDEYLQKQKERKIKKDVINQIEKIIKDEKIDILMNK